MERSEPTSHGKGPKLAVIIPFLLHGMGGEELFLEIQKHLQPLKDVSLSFINSVKIRNIQTQMLKKKWNVAEIQEDDLFSVDGRDLYCKAQKITLKEELDRIKTLKTKVHFFYYIKHFNTFTFQKMLPDLVESNSGDDTFDLIALTNKQCDIDDCYQYTEYDGKKKFVGFSKKEVFSCLKQILDTHNQPEQSEKKLDRPIKVRIFCNILKGLMDNKLSAYDLQKIGFKMVISFEFVRNSVKNFNPKVEEYFFHVLRNLRQKNQKYINFCDSNISKIINALQETSCTFDLFRVESDAALPDVLKIVESLKKVFKISEDKDEFVELQDDEEWKKTPEKGQKGENSTQVENPALLEAAEDQKKPEGETNPFDTEQKVTEAPKIQDDLDDEADEFTII